MWRNSAWKNTCRVKWDLLLTFNGPGWCLFVVSVILSLLFWSTWGGSVEKIHTGTQAFEKSFNINHTQLKSTQSKHLNNDHQVYWLCLSLSLFDLFLTAEVHFLKWEILRPRCHKRFTQCPLCNSCKTQTKLLLTPHAVPPPTKWNPRTTFGFWPITLEGDGDWKQYYESRSVIKSLLLGPRIGVGRWNFVWNNQGFILRLNP